MDSVITKFNIGDFVKYKKTEEEGKVIDIVSTLGGDDNVYEVQFGNVTRLYAEKYLDLVMASKEIVVEEEVSEPEVKEQTTQEPVVPEVEETSEEETPEVEEQPEVEETTVTSEPVIEQVPKTEKDIIKAIDVEDVTLSIRIEDEINRIINELGLVKVNSDTDVLMDSCKLLKYLATRQANINNDECNTKSIVLNELFKGLFNRDDNYITNSYLFSEILKRLGVNVYNVGLKDDNGNFYMANLVLIKGLYYYFDVTVEQAIYNSNGRVLDEFKLCSACIGSDTYQKYFTPVSIIDINSNEPKKEVPVNISKKDMDPKILNKIIGVVI